MPIRELPEEKRHDWIAAYEFRHGGTCPPGTYIGQFRSWIDAGTVTHELIIAVMEEGIRRKRDFLLKWTESVLVDLMPHGVTTPEEWERHKAEKKALDKQLAQERAQEQAANRQEARGAASKIRPRSNVILRRDEPHDDKDDDWIFENFDKKPKAKGDDDYIFKKFD